MSKPRKTLARARSLRSSMSPPEWLLWVRLRQRTPGLPSFRRQHPFDPYILDFYCPTAKLAVEIDGQSHGMGDRPAHDARREAFLIGRGLRVMHYPAELVLRDPDGVAQAVFEAARG
jgi:very-short-patch-repair endonuclease